MIDIWTLWNPTYWLSSYAKLITAIASTTTAFALPFVLPKAIALVDSAKKSEEREYRLIEINRNLQEEITERRRIEAALRISEQHLRQVLKTAPVALWTIDHERTVTFMEGKALARLGIQSEQFLGKPITTLPPSVAPIYTPAEIALNGEESVATVEIDDAIFEVRYAPLNDLSGKVDGAITVFIEITERRRVELEMQSNLEKEREISELKSRIIGTVSHEVRTPLTVINTSVEILQHYIENMSIEQKTLHMEKILAQVTHIDRLLDDMLVISKSSRRALEFKPKPLEINAFCRSLVEDMNMNVAESGHYIRFSEDICPVETRMDDWLLRQMLSNLLSNALKYSPLAEEVRFRLECTNEYVTMQVKDHGIGIPPAEKARLFETFYRASNVGTIPGTGLGLSIVWEIVKLHHGTIKVESEVGQGTTFTVRLPVQPIESASEPL
ncbi:MAG: PAS domain-containing sensor histidine kinase [Chitinophagaceae bacterium]|nr:PAS domain-containing sensor histidine kinase [Anaerolineae bacterium]